MVVAAGSRAPAHLDPVHCTLKATSSAGSPNRPPLHLREQNSPMKNRKREICTSGSVRDEGGNILIYSAGSTIRSLIPSHCKLLSSKAAAVTLAEEASATASEASESAMPREKAQAAPAVRPKVPVRRRGLSHGSDEVGNAPWSEGVVIIDERGPTGSNREEYRVRNL
jgi:hypothetical protein